MDAPATSSAAPLAASRSEAALRSAARALEAQFLAEMLKFAGLDETEGAFGGGPGEAQMSSFLREAQAEKMVAAGGVGLAEAIFESLKRREEAAHGRS